MTIWGLCLHNGNKESRKNLEQNFISQLGTLYPHKINDDPSSKWAFNVRMIYEMKLLMEPTENLEKSEPQMEFEPTTLHDL